MVAFALDVAYMHLVNSELRAATDAAAKAAVTTLNVTADLDAARQAAKDIAAANLVAGKPLVLEDSDIVFGRVQVNRSGSLTFVAGGRPVGAARVDGRKLRSSASGNVGLFFGGVFGTSHFDTQLTATAARLDRDVCLVLDRSGSMEGRKMLDLKAAVGVFCRTLEENPEPTLLGLGSYSTTATLDQSLTTDLSLIERKVNRMVADGWTNIGAGINTGRTILAGGHDAGFAEKTMVLMTDGLHNQAVSPEAAARAAKQENIVIHTVTCGRDADVRRMRAIAELTGGTYYHAPDGATLRESFRAIARNLSTVLAQ